MGAPPPPPPPRPPFGYATDWWQFEALFNKWEPVKFVVITTFPPNIIVSGFRLRTPHKNIPWRIYPILTLQMYIPPLSKCAYYVTANFGQCSITSNQSGRKPIEIYSCSWSTVSRLMHTGIRKAPRSGHESSEINPQHQGREPLIG